MTLCSSGPTPGGVRLPQDPASIRAARGLVREHLTGWGLADLIDDASLIVTELATNAVVHARSAYVVTTVRLDHAVRIEVHDEGAGVVAAGPGSLGALGGRGLLLVGALTRAWGVRDHDHGKTVWAELAA